MNSSNDSSAPSAEPTPHFPSAAPLAVLGACVARLNDIVVVTEACPGGGLEPHIVFVNEAFERLTGSRSGDVVGKSPGTLRAPLTGAAVLAYLREAVDTRRPVRAELVSQTCTRNLFWLEIDVVPVLDETGQATHCVAVARDITARKQAELERLRVHRAQQFRTACNEALVRATEETRLMREVCRLAVEVAGYRMAWAGAAVGATLIPIASAGEDSEDLAPLPIGGADDPASPALLGKTPAILDNLESIAALAPWHAVAARRGAGRVTFVPLHDGQHSDGVLVLFSPDDVPVSEEKQQLLQKLTEDLAFGIASLRHRREQAQIQDAVLKIATGVSVSSGTAFFQDLVVNMTEALGADAGFIARLQPGTRLAARTEVAYLDGELVPNFEYPLPGTPCEQLGERLSYVIPDGVSASFPCTASLTSNRAQAYVGHRLENSMGEPIGQVFVLFHHPLRDTTLIRSTLQIFATRVASELERQTADAHILRQASLLDKAQDAIMVRGLDNHIRYWNKGAERLYGWTHEELVGQSIESLLYTDPTAFRDNTQKVLQHGEWNGEIVQRRKDGSALIVEVHWTLLRDDQGEPDAILAINTDITERKRAEVAIQRLAFYDPLTGLPNRQLLRDRLQHALSLEARSRTMGALLFIDVDNFKTLNDTLGHDVGDLLLKQIAERLQATLRHGDTLARLGGDEFVIVLENLASDPSEAATLATAVSEKIIAGFAAPFYLADYLHHCTASIGVALFNDHPVTPDELLKRADLAMYQAKALGRNALHFFDPVMQAVVAARAELEAELRAALKQDAFELHYQAQVDPDGTVCGAEALLRWPHAERGWIPPASFIPLAEETGLILPLGAWVLEAACRQLVAWSAVPHLAAIKVAVNVSARQFRQADFVDQVVQVLERTGADPERLKLELTESLLVDNFDETRLKMTALKARGVDFSLDDFGTGYSSLAYLKRLPLDEIKIDRAFVHDVMSDTNDASIARSVLALGQSLDLGVVAEGVETDAQFAFLALHGCELFQGYLFNRPQSADAFAEWVAQHAPSMPMRDLFGR